MSLTDKAETHPEPFLVAVIGAGIAGLVSALSFAKFGAQVVIFEKAPELGEIGASLQLSPNATRILSDLGITDALSEHWIEPDNINLIDGISFKTLKTLPIKKHTEQNWHSPYALIRRTDLQAELIKAVQNSSSCELRLSSELDFSGLETLAGDVSLKLGKRPDLIVGADGVWSQARQVLQGTKGVDYTGYLAWRFIASKDARAHIKNNLKNLSTDADADILLFMHPDGHVALYPADKNGLSNIVFVTKHAGSADEIPDFDDMLSSLSLNSATTALLNAAENIGCWTINHVADGNWTRSSSSNAGNFALVGDAAHAMSPFMAQGAAMAIEDAFALADLICNSDQAIATSLKKYETLRKARVNRVRNRSMMNRVTYHAKGPIRAGRNIVLSLKSAESLCGELDWLYGWRAGDE